MQSCRSLLHMGPRRHHESFPLARQLLCFLDLFIVLFVACVVFVARDSLRIYYGVLLAASMTLGLLTV